MLLSSIIPISFRRNELRTFCPFKGIATYYDLELASRTVENAAWSYENPLTEAKPVGGYIAFIMDAVEEWLADEVDPVAAQAPPTQGGAMPLVDWLVHEAWTAGSSAALTEQLGLHLVEAGTPLWRLNVGIWTLHPLLAGTTFTWLRGADGVEMIDTPRGALRDPVYLNSPVRFVSEGLGGVRQRLDVDDPEF